MLCSCLENEIATHNNGTSGGTMPIVLDKVGVIKELNYLKEKRTSTMAQVEAQCLPFWPSWV
jgi:hypothetical protein